MAQSDATRTEGSQTVNLSAEQMFDLADRSAARGEFAAAETILRALFADPSSDVRNEARFRLAMMYGRSGRLADSAVLLRVILDEQPNAQRVRLELARILDLMGDEGGARRALREAQAGNLPPDVARFVDRYSAALRAQKPLGASFDIALAPDSNINRATRSDTLGTVLGDFELDDQARQQSGIGLALRGQAYGRLAIGKEVNLFGRISGSTDLYRDSDFNDIALSTSFGPELRLGSDRLSVESGQVWRWFGGQPYSRATTFGLNYSHPLGRKAQLRGSVGLALVDNRLNQLQDGRTFSGSISYERAVSSRAGVGLTLATDRQDLNDPGYSSWSGQATVFGYRELGPVTLVASLGIGRLEADERLVLFPQTRSDRFVRASLGGTFRNFRIGSFAPFLRATFERNHSSTEIYDFRKLRTEIGVTRAF